MQRMIAAEKQDAQFLAKDLGNGYFSMGGVEKLGNRAVAQGGKHKKVSFPPSARTQFSGFATPLEKECQKAGQKKYPNANETWFRV